MSLQTRLGMSAVIVSALALSACSGGVASSENANPDAVELNVLGYAALFEDQYTAAVIDKFNAAQDDIVVNFVPSQNSAEMLGKLRSESSAPTVDVAILDASVAHTGNQEGLFSKVSASDVPNLANVVELGQSADGYGPAVTFDNLVVLYNTAEVKTPPKGIADLWDAPENSVSIPAPPDIQGHTLTILTANNLGVDYRDGIEPAVEKLAELAPLVNTWEPVPDVYQPVISGTSQYGVGWNARAQYFAEDSDGAMSVVQPDDGIGFQINTINLVEGTENAEAAKKFMDYALSSEAQQSFAEALFYAPVVSGVELPADVSDRVADSADPNIVDIDWIWLADERDAWTEQWRRSVIGG
ncbi:putative spermidine/putrescine transport system substrate-binding protein [Leucobacter luti]|uniref:extracellular solute-binding protein n=1 Tax=Leucobacter luti TaxID=340320 RepID=UPI00104A4641|nr:extracellular solute-binding protein [Leucobacter luti]MCW2289556.1 putative spermidine/putrescine transport system substrate-binding protein [Leucobacter luti]TCK37728.1 putative spermidine/putrescine transport system substrate-binding protein [Leucobacter luti]